MWTLVLVFCFVKKWCLVALNVRWVTIEMVSSFDALASTVIVMSMAIIIFLCRIALGKLYK